MVVAQMHIAQGAQTLMVQRSASVRVCTGMMSHHNV